MNNEYGFLATERGLDLSALAKDIYALGKEANTLPMEYFEAKTYRAFPFSEAAGIVVPDTLPKETQKKLSDLGANVLTYKDGDNEDRLRVVNGIDGARFSRDAGGIYTEKEYNDYGWARANNLLTAEANELWKSQLRNMENAPKAFDGSKIIAVSDEFGVGNTLVYTKGTFENPKIVKVVTVAEDEHADFDVDTILDYIREGIYESEKWDGNAIARIKSMFPEGYINEYSRFDMPNYRSYADNARAQQQSRRNSATSGKQQRSRASSAPGEDGRLNIADAKVKPFKSYVSVAKIKEKIKYGFPLKDSEKAILDSKGIRYPADNPKTRYSSETDSAGNSLTEAQAEFFRDSKVRDENGNLLVVYHGTDADFTVFDKSKGGTKGHAEGFGFYFSANQEITSKYGSIQMKGYLDIKKPLYDNKKTITLAETVKFAKALAKHESEASGESWRDGFLSNYVYTPDLTLDQAARQVASLLYRQNDTDQNVIYDFANGAGYNYNPQAAFEFYDVLEKSIGFDGNIVEWTADGKNTIYVAFKQNQFKNADNLNPTANEDIRYSGEITVSTNGTAESFGIVNLKDSVGVARSVFRTLQEEGFFTSGDYDKRIVKNDETGYEIVIDRKSINEVFSASNFSRFGKDLKVQKLSTVRAWPEIIKRGIVVADDVADKHGRKNVSFLYISSDVTIDGTPSSVKVGIKKSAALNRFWVVYISTDKIAIGTEADARGMRISTKTDGYSGMLSRETDNVKTRDVRYSREVSGSDAMHFVDSFYNRDTVKSSIDDFVVEANRKWLLEQFEDGRYYAIAKTLSEHTSISENEAWNKLAPLLLKKEGVAKYDGKTFASITELSEKSLRKALELGGFAAPSIGIVDLDNPTTGFGDITFIFPSWRFNADTDPAFDGDAEEALRSRGKCSHLQGRRQRRPPARGEWNRRSEILEGHRVQQLRPCAVQRAMGEILCGN